MPLSSAGLACKASLTGGEKVNLTLTFLLDDLFLQVFDGLGMLPVE